MPAVDKYGGQFRDDATVSIDTVEDITLDTEQTFIGRGLYVGVTGDVNCILAGMGTTAKVFTGLLGGMWHPMRVRKVLTSSTTATGMKTGV